MMPRVFLPKIATLECVGYDHKKKEAPSNLPLQDNRSNPYVSSSIIANASEMTTAIMKQLERHGRSTLCSDQEKSGCVPCLYCFDRPVAFCCDVAY